MPPREAVSQPAGPPPAPLPRLPQCRAAVATSSWRGAGAKIETPMRSTMLRVNALGLMVLVGLASPARVHYGPSTRATALQHAVDRGIAQRAASVSVQAGDYYFGNTSLVVHQAANLTLRAEDGPGTVQLWFSIGAGLLVNQSTDVVLDGLSIDYDPPAHYQGTVLNVITNGSGSSDIQALVQTDPGFIDPHDFNTLYQPGTPGVQSSPGPALVWNSSDPGFGAYASASWPPTEAAGGRYTFNLSRISICKEIQFTTTDGSSCRDPHATMLRPRDKITAHIRVGFTLHILNSTRVRTQHTAIHGAPGFAVSEYDGYGNHSYFNVSLSRRHVQRNHSSSGGGGGGGEDYYYDAQSMCGTTNPTGGRLCLGMIASNNDGLHSSGCQFGPTFERGELSYCLDDWINVHSRTQIVPSPFNASFSELFCTLCASVCIIFDRHLPTLANSVDKPRHLILSIIIVLWRPQFTEPQNAESDDFRHAGAGTAKARYAPPDHDRPPSEPSALCPRRLPLRQRRYTPDQSNARNVHDVTFETDQSRM
eukprot:COSAG05_NODE_2607_length_2846_cov_13.463497_1_plen_536_part_00